MAENKPVRKVPANTEVKEIGRIKIFMNQVLGEGATATVYRGYFKEDVSA